MLFCPNCANMLLIEKQKDDLRFFCKTCPYIFVVTDKLEKTMPLQRKNVDDVLGGIEEWKDVDKTDIRCENYKECDGLQSYYKRL